MPNIKSAKKRVRSNDKRRAYNASFKSSMRTAVKKVHTAVEANDKAEAEVSLQAAYKKLDQAQSKNILHKNNVARKKSTLANLVNTVK